MRCSCGLVACIVSSELVAGYVVWLDLLIVLVIMCICLLCYDVIFFVCVVFVVCFPCSG